MYYLFLLCLLGLGPLASIGGRIGIEFAAGNVKMVGYEMKFEDFRFGKNTEKTRTKK